MTTRTLIGLIVLPVAALLGALAVYALTMASAGARWTPAPFLLGRSTASSVQYYIADLKTSFPEHELYSPATALTSDNYRTVLDSLKTKAGVNGVRLPIIPAYATGQDYPALYHEVYDYARGIGLKIYASPMAVGMSAFQDWGDERYVAWLSDYARPFRPDFLSPFNEAGVDDDEIVRIVTMLRPKLDPAVELVGPDRQRVDGTLRSLRKTLAMATLFDIVGTHNADRDGSATISNWTRLTRATSRPVWASENPADWDHGKAPGLPGINQAVAGGVQGVVVWMAKPSLVDGEGHLTAKARRIAANLDVVRR